MTDSTTNILALPLWESRDSDDTIPILEPQPSTSVHSKFPLVSLHAPTPLQTPYKMPEPAQVNRSLSTVRTELEFLRDSGVLLPQQLDSIMAQLPQNGQPSQYVDSRYGGSYGQQQWQPSGPQFQQISQAALDPQSPANPKHAKVCFCFVLFWLMDVVGREDGFGVFGECTLMVKFSMRIGQRGWLVNLGMR